jgi:peptidoglycan hydrolase-like protein with peptidoglycan-binding domain
MDCSKVNLVKGSKGEDVKELQKYLKYLGYYSSEVDGEYGDKTINAVKKLQKQYKLKEDGIFGSISCKSTGINGVDVSNSTLTLDKSTYLDMFERFDSYTSKNKVEPNIIYLDKNNPYKYVTKSKLKELKSQYNNYLASHNSKPDCLNMKVVSNAKNGVYYSRNHWVGKGCNKLGQCTPYYCGVHSIRQCDSKKGLDQFLESMLAGYAGTTSHGTSHDGINTALRTVQIKTGIPINVKWVNFSDLGADIRSRFKKIGELISNDNCSIIVHNLYRGSYGHYEVIKEVNMNNNTCVVLNSLGSRCNKPAYCGYLETRSFNTFASYIAGISQKSICIVTYGG